MALSIRGSLDAVSLSSLGDEVEALSDNSDRERPDPSNVCLRCRLLDHSYVGWHESDTDESTGYFIA